MKVRRRSEVRRGYSRGRGYVTYGWTGVCRLEFTDPSTYIRNEVDCRLRQGTDPYEHLSRNYYNHYLVQVKWNFLVFLNFPRCYTAWGFR